MTEARRSMQNSIIEYLQDARQWGSVGSGVELLELRRRDFWSETIRTWSTPMSLTNRVLCEGILRDAGLDAIRRSPSGQEVLSYGLRVFFRGSPKAWAKEFIFRLDPEDVKDVSGEQEREWPTHLREASVLLYEFLSSSKIATRATSFYLYGSSLGGVYWTKSWSWNPQGLPGGTMGRCEAILGAIEVATEYLQDPSQFRFVADERSTRLGEIVMRVESPSSVKSPTQRATRAEKLDLLQAPVRDNREVSPLFHGRQIRRRIRLDEE